MVYEVEITPEGLRRLNQVSEKVRAAVLETILGTIAENPRRAGKPLRGELEGLYSALRGEFRIIYEIDEETKVVLVHRAQHRRPLAYKRSGSPSDGECRVGPSGLSALHSAAEGVCHGGRPACRIALGSRRRRRERSYGPGGCRLQGPGWAGG